jgi:hypothetical protein
VEVVEDSKNPSSATLMFFVIIFKRGLVGALDEEGAGDARCDRQLRDGCGMKFATMMAWVEMVRSVGGRVQARSVRDAAVLVSIPWTSWAPATRAGA